MGKPAGTLYIVIICFIFALNITAQDSSLTFTTPPDYGALTSSSVTIGWGTNRETYGIVEYGDSLLNETYFTQESLTEHNIVLEGLKPNTMYYARVGISSRADTSLEIIYSETFSFTTLPDNRTYPAVKIISGDVDVYEGDSFAFEALYYINSDSTANTSVSWNVRPESLGNITGAGVFTAKETGQGYVIASAGKIRDSVAVYVLEEYIGNSPYLIVEPGDVTVYGDTTIEFTALFVDTGGNKKDTTAIWSLEGDSVGVLSDMGVLSINSQGSGIVRAGFGEYTAYAAVTVIDSSFDTTTSNSVTLSRIMPDGTIFPVKNFREGGILRIEGLPGPMSHANKTALYFSPGSIDRDIELRVTLPEFVEHTGNYTYFGQNVVNALTMEVYSDGLEKEDYYFNEPLVVTMPFSREVMENEGLSPGEISLLLYENGEYTRVGITGTVVDISRNRIICRVNRLGTFIIGSSDKLTEIRNTAPAKPENLTLEQNYPNPFNPSTTIVFAIPDAGNVKISIHNILGEEVHTIVNRDFTAGSHSVKWDASEFASGVYIYRVSANGKSIAKKMMLIK